MSEKPIPAWKRAGIKRSGDTSQPASDSYDPLKEGLKRVHESGESKKPTKPPKRAKVAKSERSAPTYELDQLAYLRQYSEDRANWKFSKQKQNWILKHIFTYIADDKYDAPLLNYIEGLQGAARSWVCDDARKVVDEWNRFMLEEPDKGTEGTAEGEEAASAERPPTEKPPSDQPPTDAEEKSGAAAGPAKKPKLTPKAAPQRAVPSEKMARRAQSIIKLISNEEVKLELLDTGSQGGAQEALHSDKGTSDT